MDYIDEYHQDKFYATILETENIRAVDHQFQLALLHKDLKVKTSHIYSNLSDNSGMWSA
ncbi:hypothetical protein [Acinetobacter baumannii]|uniref:Uncharacterized protein n=1 Tax=Acinetobacter baumannii NIPH 80 TaxID=1217629 RepID=N9L568_ACIBA|nr:hypothetical protein F913_01471 [Acinetobacter baumannii NIPH 80]